MNKSDQILKCRDDKAPVLFSKVGNDGDPELMFKLTGETECSWAKSDETFGPAKLRPRIEPWLIALFQSEHFALLVGSGLSNAVHQIATSNKLPGMNPVKFTKYDAEINIEAKKSAEAAGRENGNIEDQIRVANELLRGLEIAATSDKELKITVDALATDLTKVLNDFAASILKSENSLITAKAELLEKAFNYLVSYLMSFASRTGTRDRLQVFT